MPNPTLKSLLARLELAEKRIATLESRQLHTVQHYHQPAIGTQWPSYPPLTPTDLKNYLRSASF